MVALVSVVLMVLALAMGESKEPLRSDVPASTLRIPAKNPFIYEASAPKRNRSIAIKRRYPRLYGISCPCWTGIVCILLCVLIVLLWSIWHWYKVKRRRKMAAYGVFRIDPFEKSTMEIRRKPERKVSKKRDQAKAEAKMEPKKIKAVDQKKPDVKVEITGEKKLITKGNAGDTKLAKTDTSRESRMLGLEKLTPMDKSKISSMVEPKPAPKETKAAVEKKAIKADKSKESSMVEPKGTPKKIVEIKEVKPASPKAKLSKQVVKKAAEKPSIRKKPGKKS